MLTPSYVIQPRSQLVTNRFLTALAETFGSKAFTSRDVSNRLGLDFLNVCKVLSRMSKRPYYLLLAIRRSRLLSGYENSYTISPKGWSKINYMRTKAAPVQEAESNILNTTMAYEYLLNGKGTVAEFSKNLSLRSTVKLFSPSLYLPKIEGDFGLFPRGTSNPRVKSDPSEPCRTFLRASHFRELGIIPAEIDLPLFINTAYQNGSSQTEILLSLLLRGGIGLRDAYNSVKALLKSNLDKSESYNDQLKELQSKILTFQIHMLESENNSLREKLRNAGCDAVLERAKLNSRYDRLAWHVVGINQCLLELSQGLEKFDSSPILGPIKQYVRTLLTGIGLMNYIVVSSNDV